MAQRRPNLKKSNVGDSTPKNNWNVGEEPSFQFETHPARLRGVGDVVTMLITDGVDREYLHFHHPAGLTGLGADEWVVSPTSGISDLSKRLEDPKGPQRRLQREQRVRDSLVASGDLVLVNGTYRFPGEEQTIDSIFDEEGMLVKHYPFTTEEEVTEANLKRTQKWERQKAYAEKNRLPIPALPSPVEIRPRKWIVLKRKVDAFKEKAEPIRKAWNEENPRTYETKYLGFRPQVALPWAGRIPKARDMTNRLVQYLADTTRGHAQSAGHAHTSLMSETGSEEGEEEESGEPDSDSDDGVKETLVESFLRITREMEESLRVASDGGTEIEKTSEDPDKIAKALKQAQTYLSRACSSAKGGLKPLPALKDTKGK